MQVASTGERVKINRKLRLDDALKRQGQEGWSEARKNAYKLIGLNNSLFFQLISFLNLKNRYKSKCLLLSI